MKVTSAAPFGPDNLVEWSGPKLMSGSNPNWGALRKSNATTYVTANGDAYFGGTLSAGVLKTAVTNTDKNPYATNSYPVHIGPFGTHRKRKVVVVSFVLQASSRSSARPNPSATTISWQLQRKIGSSSWATVNSGMFSGIASFFYDGEHNNWHISESIHGSSTFTDNNTSGADFQYRVRITEYQRYHATSSVRQQELTIISTEQ